MSNGKLLQFACIQAVTLGGEKLLSFQITVLLILEPAIDRPCRKVENNLHGLQITLQVVLYRKVHKGEDAHQLAINWCPNFRSSSRCHHVPDLALPIQQQHRPL